MPASRPAAADPVRCRASTNTPTPEPMSDDDRAEKRAMADGGVLDAASARAFVDANVGAPLDPTSDATAVDDVQRASAEAWTAWFDRGSREDWSETVGVLDVPPSSVVKKGRLEPGRMFLVDTAAGRIVD